MPYPIGSTAVNSESRVSGITTVGVSESTESPISNSLIGVGRSTAVFEFFMTTFEKIVTTGRTFKGWFTGSSTDTSPQINPPVSHQRHPALATAQQQSVEPPLEAPQTGVETDPTPQVAEAKPSLIERLCGLFSTTPTESVAEAKPSWIKSLLKSCALSVIPVLADVNSLRKISAITTFGLSAVFLGFGMLFPPFLPAAGISVFLIGGLCCAVTIWAPRLSERFAQATAWVAKGKSSATQAKITAGVAFTVGTMHGDPDPLTMVPVGYGLGLAAPIIGTERAIAATTAGAVAKANVYRAAYRCLLNPLVTGWSGTGAAITCALLSGKIEGSSQLGLDAAEGAVLGDNLGPFVACILSGDFIGAMILALGYGITDFGLNYLPGSEAPILKEYIGPIIKTMINFKLLSTDEQFYAMFAPYAAGLAFCAYQRRGAIKAQTLHFLEQGRASALAAAKNVAVSAIGKVESAVVVTKNVAVSATETAKSAVVVVKNVAEVVESVTGKIDDSITKTCTLFNEEEIGDAFQDAFQRGLFGPTETADPFEKPAENVNHMDDDDDDDYYDAQEVSYQAQANFETPAEDVGGMDDDDDDDYYDAQEEVRTWAQEIDDPFEKLAEKETPAASIWKKIVTGLSNLESHLFVSEDDIDDGIGDAFQVGLLETTHDMTKDAGTSGTLTKIKEVLRVTGAG